MWRWLVVCVATSVSAAVEQRANSRYINSQYDCYEYPEVPFRSYEPGWAIPKKIAKFSMQPKYVPHPAPFINVMRRLDVFLSNHDDIVKEHAKLVHDINSLKQVMYVAPLPEATKDYDDSIFPEILETITTTVKPSKSKGFPVLMLGGNRKNSIKSPSKQTFNLVGTSVTPLVKPTFSYAMASSNRHPVRICMPVYSTLKRRPSFWEQILKSIVPK